MMANIVEWLPLNFGDIFGKYFLILLLAFMLAQFILRSSWRLDEIVLFLAGIAGACLHMRLILAFVPFSAPLFGVIVARGGAPYESGKDKHALNAVLMTLVAAAVIGFFPSQAALERIVEQSAPVRAVAYIRQHPAPKPMFNTYGYGGYLIWQMSDVNKVFIDGRADIYERTGVLADYSSAIRLGLPAPFILNAYNIQSCLLGRYDTLVTLLDASPGWKKVYGDPISVLYVRRPRTVDFAPSRYDPRSKAYEP
jgi:hypothetical protein